MTLAILVKELRQMSAKRRNEKFREMTEAAKRPRNGQYDGLRDKVLAYEKQYGMDSKAMLQRFKAGELQDTADISLWLMYLDVLEER